MRTSTHKLQRFEVVVFLVALRTRPFIFDVGKHWKPAVPYPLSSRLLHGDLIVADEIQCKKDYVAEES